MIESDSGFVLTLEQMVRMYRAIDSLRRDIAPINHARYQLLAEGPIDEICKLRAEIDQYLGIQESAVASRS